MLRGESLGVRYGGIVHPGQVLFSTGVTQSIICWGTRWRRQDWKLEERQDDQFDADNAR
jgi:hypothetical protein